METGYTPELDQEFQPGSRLRYLMYRCHKCGKPITALQIEAAWKKAEKFNEGKPVKEQKHGDMCVCGSRHVTPSNASWFEELTRPSIWRLWTRRVVWPWLKEKLGR